MKIFLLEDDCSLNDSIKEILESEKFVVDSFDDGLKAYENISTYYDLYIFDINVPNVDGLFLLEHIKKINQNSKVIIISANINITKLKEAYKKGCDDYLKKPFDLEELLLKVGKYNQNINRVYLNSECFFDIKEKRLFVDNTEVGLTTVEAKLLLLLILNQGKSIEQTQIEEFVHDGVSKTSNSTRSAIKRLKKKLPENIIHNSFNEGYFIKI
ncbi:response regulator transcription factor [Aliarcobacter cryaerophilus]|jgi:DNA-binding response OmpR family regulator|uniref:response regulator transcription factor n=1 Tax=Aliarcobacter cryaerophilus TaxID=28198 RepID=UPI003DA4AA4E